MNVNPFSYLIEKLKGYVSKSGDTVFGDLTVNAENGTAGADAYTYLKVGNQTPKSSAKHSTGLLRLCGENGKYTDIYAPNSTASRDIVFPNASGTVALTSDITWNYLGVINGTLPLPSTFNELFIRCDFEKAKIYSVLNIPKLSLEATERTYGSGNYALSNVNYGFEVYVSTTSIRTNWIFKNNGDIKSTSEIAVYYR